MIKKYAAFFFEVTIVQVVIEDEESCAFDHIDEIKIIIKKSTN